MINQLKIIHNLKYLFKVILTFIKLNYVIFLILTNPHSLIYIIITNILYPEYVRSHLMFTKTKSLGRDTEYPSGPQRPIRSSRARRTYNYWDEVNLNPPANAKSATIDLLYQPTSWEYIQFLYQANDKSIPFLDQEGDNILDAWLNTKMAKPHVMASTAWTAQ
jgi:hypothetical protein